MRVLSVRRRLIHEDIHGARSMAFIWSISARWIGPQELSIPIAVSRYCSP
jgi:hypothetical protein